MKKRVSQKAAEYSITRAEWYLKECEKIMYLKEIELQIDEQKVFIIKEKQKIFLLEITNPKTTWFEIWLKLSNR